MVTTEQVFEALEAVHDPHIPVSLRSMNMIEAVAVRPDGDVEVRVRIPCTSCPGIGLLKDAVRAALTTLSGIGSIAVVESWEPWDRALVAPEARALMHVHGIQI